VSEQAQFDDRPPIDVERFHPTTRGRLLEVDHALGVLEADATHARNHFRDLVRSDDLAENEAMVANVGGTLGECVKCAEALRGGFAAFDGHLRGDQA
jgi:hypothetical protein